VRSRILSFLLGAALITAGLTGLVAQAPSAAAAAAGERLFFHSAAGSYQGDVQADPTTLTGNKGPNGATLTTAPPTKTADATGTSSDPFGFQGSPRTPTWTLPYKGPISSICFDLWASYSTATFVLQPYLQDGDHVTANALETYASTSTLKVTPYTAGTLVRVTGLGTLKAAYTATGATTLSFLVNSAGDSATLAYDSVAHPSSIIINSPTCTAANFPAPAGAAPAPAPPAPAPSAEPSASASTSAEPSAEPSGEPSASASGEPSAGSCGDGASADPSANGSASADPDPSASASGSTVPQAPGTSQATLQDPARDPTSCRVTSITLATNATTITAGNSPILSGVARDERGDAVEGATITIYTKGYGENSYTAAATVQTDSAGQWRLSIRPAKLTAVGANVGGAKSRVLSIRVNTRVTINSPQPGAAARTQTFTGTLTPGYARVAVGLGYFVNGQFVVLTQTNTDGAGRYSVTARLPRGTYAFVLFTSAHQGTDKGSRSVKLTVR